MSEAWRPSCQVEQLRARAQLLAAVRAFFQSRKVLEVETPLLCQATGTDPQLDFFCTDGQRSVQRSSLYLQTSPEFAMKRLLAAGSGSIYQICKAFRNGESGRFHNPEFTILEWYRVDYCLHELMHEVAELITTLLEPHRVLGPTRIIAYQQLFIDETGLDPLVFSVEQYRDYARRQGFGEAIDICEDNHSMWLDFIFSHKIQPSMGEESLCLVHGYPAIQSSLARISASDARVAERFEVFVRGIELGNGFFELADAAEQEERFDQEIAERRSRRLPAVEKDRRFLAALQSGLPDCSGVAIGLDRLLMILTGAACIDDILAFPIARA
ncbi:EF-P lysine aminoacylase EpmA [Methylomarinum sp. Ch1-1]|uniref:EF-P lysine aminoacylase EpmA n=1 Tax=Methylomarinum roseum TaxID=3067653 RepID=A0AAU7NPS4_9GAMM